MHIGRGNVTSPMCDHGKNNGNGGKNDKSGWKSKSELKQCISKDKSIADSGRNHKDETKIPWVERDARMELGIGARRRPTGLEHKSEIY